MSDGSVYLVVELWINPESVSELKIFKKIMNEILNEHSPEYVHHSHALEWISNKESEELPTGIEIIKFKNEESARKAVFDLQTKALKENEKKIFFRIRSYLSRVDFPKELTSEFGL